MFNFIFLFDVAILVYLPLLFNVFISVCHLSVFIVKIPLDEVYILFI